MVTQPNDLLAAIQERDYRAIKSELTRVDVRSSVVAELALKASAANGDAEAMRLVLAAGADPNVQGRRQFTPLRWAVEYRCIDCVQVLLAAGASANLPDEDGHSALHRACFYNDAVLVELLVRAGADVNASVGQGWTPAHRAAFEGNTDVLRLLHNAGANLNAVDSFYGTPLDVADTYSPTPFPKAGFAHEYLITNGATALRNPRFMK